MNAAPELPLPSSVASDVVHLLAREGYLRLAEALRELLGGVRDAHASTPRVAVARDPEGDAVVFTPFRPPPLDQGTWLDRARQVAIAHAFLRKEASDAAVEWLEGRCGLRFDEAQVERAGIGLDAQIRAWRRRRLPRPFWLFVHTWRERVFQPAGAECWPATLVVGIDSHGYRMVADLVFGPPGEPHWEDILKALDVRGISPESGGLTAKMIPELFEAVTTRWPGVRFQICQRQFLSRLAARDETASSGFPTRLNGGVAEQSATLGLLLSAHPQMQPWAIDPVPGKPSVLTAATLPRDLRPAIASLQWLEREIRQWRTRALQDRLALSPSMKARLLSAAAIEWEGTLDVRRPFVDSEFILEILQADSHKTPKNQ